MILIGLGGNLPSVAGDAAATLRAALALFPAQGLTLRAVSGFYRSAPVPASDQPWFVNAVAEIETTLPPPALLSALLDIEKKFGRVRGAGEEKNAPRTLDLDVLDYHGQVHQEPGLVLPHPRLHERAFVLVPLLALAPHWRHPLSGKDVKALVGALPPGQQLQLLPPA